MARICGEGANMSRTIIAATVGIALLGACADMSPTEQRLATGTVGGAAGGAVIGALAGNAALGTAIGAGAGLGAGFLVDQHRRAEERAFQRGVAQGRSQR